MITLDMTRKAAGKPVTDNAFTLEQGVLTLQVSLGTYSLTGKTVTAAFSPKLVETTALVVTNGIIAIPISSNLIEAGINEIQLNIRTLTTLEQSPIMRWNVLESIFATTSPSQDPDLTTEIQNDISALEGDVSDLEDGKQDKLENGTLGTELITNGDFATTLNSWTGTNWAWSAGTALHTAGATTALSQALPAVVGNTYKVVYTISASTVGSVRMYFGGVYGQYGPGNLTFTDYITATTTDTFEIIPTSDFDGKIDLVSVKVLTSTAVNVDGEVTFRKSIKISDKIDVADGLPISIGFNSLPVSSRGTYNIPSSSIAIGYECGNATTTGQLTAVGYQAGKSQTDGVLTAFGKWAGMSNTSGHSTFIGNAAGRLSTTGSNTCIGDECGGSTTTGIINANGYYAGFGNVDGNVTAFGFQAGRNCGASGNLTAFGHNAGYNSTGLGCTALGYEAGKANTTGLSTSVGYQALLANVDGNAVGVGYKAGVNNTSGLSVSVGYEAGRANTSGRVTAVGHSAGKANTTGQTVAIGYQAGLSATTGFPTMVGYNAGAYATTGDVIALGFQAGYGATSANAPVTDTKSIYIGNYTNRSVASATKLDNCIAIGDTVLVDKSNQVKIGNANIVEHVLGGTATSTVIASGNSIQITNTKTPSAANDTGTAGTICWDANYLYVCTAANTWTRIALAW